jgi:hypothetical protein
MSITVISVWEIAMTEENRETLLELRPKRSVLPLQIGFCQRIQVTYCSIA